MSPDELDRRSRTIVYNSLVDTLSELKSTIVDGVYHDETLEVLRESHALVLKLLEWVEPTPYSYLIDHAKRELEIIGEDPAVIQSYLDIIRVFRAQGHSGGSASVFVPTIQKLLSFENLSPITNDPIEWIQVDEDYWQNTRNSKFFSKDGGESYYDLNDESRTLVLSKNVTG